MDEVAEMNVKLLKLMHSKIVKPDTMPDMKAKALEWAGFLRDDLPAGQFEKLCALVDAVPQDMHMMHGDYHIKNVMLQNGEVLLIDMDTLCHSHLTFELASMYNTYCGYCAIDHSIDEKFLGISYETACAFWRKSLALYPDTEDDERIQSVEDKARIIGFPRIMRRTIRRGGLNTEDGRALIAYCRTALAELLPKADTLLF